MSSWKKEEDFNLKFSLLFSGQSNQNHDSLAPSGQDLKGVGFSSFKSESSSTSDLQQNIMSNHNKASKPSATEEMKDKG